MSILFLMQFWLRYNALYLEFIIVISYIMYDYDEISKHFYLKMFENIRKH